VEIQGSFVQIWGSLRRYGALLQRYRALLQREPPSLFSLFKRCYIRILCVSMPKTRASLQELLYMDTLQELLYMDTLQELLYMDTLQELLYKDTWRIYAQNPCISAQDAYVPGGPAYIHPIFMRDEGLFGGDIGLFCADMGLFA